MNRLNKFLKTYPDATVEDWKNQRHLMHVRQATEHCRTKHVGSKNIKQLMALINH